MSTLKSLKREFPAVLLSNSDHIETSQNTNCRDQELSGMVRVTATYKILGVWDICNDFHSVSMVISDDFLPTRTPLPYFGAAPTRAEGSDQKFLNGDENISKTLSLRDFSPPFSLKMLLSGRSRRSFFLKKKTSPNSTT